MSCSSSSYDSSTQKRSRDEISQRVVLTEKQQFYARITDLIENKQDDIKKLFEILKNNKTFLDILYLFKNDNLDNEKQYLTTLLNLNALIKDKYENHSKNTYVSWKWGSEIEFNTFIMKLVLFSNNISKIMIEYFHMNFKIDDCFYYFEKCRNLQRLRIDNFNNCNFSSTKRFFNSLQYFKNTLIELRLGNIMPSMFQSDIGQVNNDNDYDSINMDFWKDNQILEYLKVSINDWNFIRTIYTNIFRELSNSENNLNTFSINLVFYDHSNDLSETSLYGSRNNNIDCFESIMYLIEILSKTQRLKNLAITHNSCRVMTFLNYPFFNRLFTSLSQPNNAINQLRIDVIGLLNEIKTDINPFTSFFKLYSPKLNTFILKLYHVLRLNSEELEIIYNLLKAVCQNNSISNFYLMKNSELKNKKTYNLSRSDYCRFFVNKQIHDLLIQIFKKQNINTFRVFDNTSNILANDRTYNEIVKVIKYNNNLIKFSTFPNLLSFPHKEKIDDHIRQYNISLNLPNYTEKLLHINELIQNNVQSSNNKKTSLFALLWNVCYDSETKSYKEESQDSLGDSLKKQRIK